MFGIFHVKFSLLYIVINVVLILIISVSGWGQDEEDEHTYQWYLLMCTIFYLAFVSVLFICTPQLWKYLLGVIIINVSLFTVFNLPLIVKWLYSQMTIDKDKSLKEKYNVTQADEGDINTYIEENWKRFLQIKELAQVKGVYYKFKDAEQHLYNLIAYYYKQGYNDQELYRKIQGRVASILCAVEDYEDIVLTGLIQKVDESSSRIINHVKQTRGIND